MQQFGLILRMTVVSLINLLQFMLFVRAILSWFPQMRSNGIVSFLYFVTEPVLAPIRSLLRRIPALDNMPIDLSIIVAFLLLSLLSRIIYMI